MTNYKKNLRVFCLTVLVTGGLFLGFPSPEAIAHKDDHKPKFKKIGSVVINDANGKRVGTLLSTGTGIGLGGETVVANQIKDVLFALRITVDPFNGISILSGTRVLLFEAADCTSPPLMRKDSVTDNDMFQPSAVAGEGPGQPGNIVYVQDLDETPILLATQGILNSAGTCNPGPVNFPVVSARKLVDLSDLTPPFRAKRKRR